MLRHVHHEPAAPSQGKSRETDLHGWNDAVIAPFVTRRAQLLRACKRWTRGHSADAEDLLADACLRVAESVRRPLTDVSAPVAFCMTVIANLARDRRRSGKRHAEEALPPLAAAKLTARALAPDELFDSRELILSMAARFEHLPARQRRALVLRCLGRDYQEIATFLATSPANARKLVQLARFSIRGHATTETRPARSGLSCRTTCPSVAS